MVIKLRGFVTIFGEGLGDTLRGYRANTVPQGYLRDNAEIALASIQFMTTPYIRPCAS
jgi:hypothetical protein